MLICVGFGGLCPPAAGGGPRAGEGERCGGGKGGPRHTGHQGESSRPRTRLREACFCETFILLLPVIKECLSIVRQTQGQEEGEDASCMDGGAAAGEEGEEVRSAYHISLIMVLVER